MQQQKWILKFQSVELSVRRAEKRTGSGGGRKKLVAFFSIPSPSLLFARDALGTSAEEADPDNSFGIRLIFPPPERNTATVRTSVHVIPWPRFFPSWPSESSVLAFHPATFLRGFHEDASTRFIFTDRQN